jgi:endonuclease-3 related protein
MRGAPLTPLRRELLAVPGLGPETADAILLYAAGRPVFVADAYVRRVLTRHRLLLPGAGYEQARAVIEAHLPSDPVLFNEFHALLVAVAKSNCRTVPRCATCPLRRDLDGRAPAPH